MGVCQQSKPAESNLKDYSAKEKNADHLEGAMMCIHESIVLSQKLGYEYS